MGDCYSRRDDDAEGRRDDVKANLTGVDRRKLSILTSHNDQSKTGRRRPASIFAAAAAAAAAEIGRIRTIFGRVQSACTSTVLGIVVDEHVVGDGE